MADILPSQPTIASSSSTESAGNLPIDRSKKNLSSHTNKYNGHVTRLRNVFNGDQSVPTMKQSKSKSSTTESMIDHPLIHEDFSSSSSPSHRRYSPSEQHYDFPADVLQQLKKHQQREDNEGQIPRPSFLPPNVFKRMNHLNTTFVKPTKIESIPITNLTKKDSERTESLESPGANDTDLDSLIYYEIAGLDNTDQDENDDSLNDIRRVRFSHAPIRVYPTYSPKEYDRRNEDIDPYAASAEYELEKRIEKMDVFNLQIEKGNDSLGISILGMGVGADSGLEKLGIFVKTLNPDGVIGRDGRIQVGDQIIEVDNQSLVGVTHLYATNVLKNTSGVVKIVIGREKDMNKSEILSLIQRSLQMDKEREEMSRNFHQYHDAYYEQHFTDEDSENLKEQKLVNQFEIEILKQCYESLEKTLETTEKDKEHYQQLYEQLLNDFKEIEGKYLEAKVLIKQHQDREIELKEQHEKQVHELLKKIDELEKTILVVPKNPSRLPSLSMDKMSIYSQQESWPVPINLSPMSLGPTTTNKSLEHLDRNLSVTRLKLPTKHFSTPSLGEISNDSEVFSNTIPSIPSLSFETSEPMDIKDWTVDQCIQWLTAQKMTSLISLFLTRSINGEKLLLLDSTKMKAMGIKSSRDREELKSKIKELKRTELHRARERLLNQSSVSSIPSISKRVRSSSLTRLKERRFFTSTNSGK